MAFWDNVKSVASEAAGTLSNAANDVANSAREYNEKSKLKRALRAENEKIDGCYRAIGEKFRQSNPVPPAGYSEIYDNLRISEREAERLKAELAKYEANK